MLLGNSNEALIYLNQFRPQTLTQCSLVVLFNNWHSHPLQVLNLQAWRELGGASWAMRHGSCVDVEPQDALTTKWAQRT